MVNMGSLKAQKSNSKQKIKMISAEHQIALLPAEEGGNQLVSPVPPSHIHALHYIVYKNILKTLVFFT